MYGLNMVVKGESGSKKEESTEEKSSFPPVILKNHLIVKKCYN